MRARVKADCRWSSITAFGGLEMVRDEWRQVPAGCEDEARRNPYLEVEELTAAGLDREGAGGPPPPAPPAPENDPEPKGKKEKK